MLPARWDLLVHKVIKVTLARKVQWGQPGRKVQWAQPVKTVIPAQWVLLAPKVNRAKKGIPVRKGLWGQLVP